MKTLICIHGAESFSNDAAYREFLIETYIERQSEPWTPEVRTTWVQEIARKWYVANHRVFMPIFPNKQNAKYADWKIVFEGILRGLSLDDEITLIGGSLGGCFLLKYFSEMN